MVNGNDLPVPVQTGVKVLSEIVIPGGSNLIKGDIKQGGIHAVLGFVAGAMLGLPGIVLVSANSLSKATTGGNLWEHFGFGQTAEADPRPPAAKGKAS